MPNFLVNGIVARRDGLPYVQLSTEQGMICQLTIAEARNVALDILQMAARTEADAMIHKFFAASEFPPEAGTALMGNFRDFRAALDDEQIIRGRSES